MKYKTVTSVDVLIDKMGKDNYVVSTYNKTQDEYKHFCNIKEDILTQFIIAFGLTECWQKSTIGL